MPSGTQVRRHKTPGMVWGGFRASGLGVDKINILLQTSIGVLRIEGPSLDPPYINILESRKLRI